MHQNRLFSTTKSLRVDPLAVTALAFKTINPGTLPLIYTSFLPRIIGAAYVVYLFLNTLEFELSQSLVLDFRNGVRGAEMVNGYLFDIDNFINSLRSQWINSHHTMEELHSIYIHLQQLITIHESMFDTLADIVNRTENRIDLGEYNETYDRIREQGGNLVELLRSIENYLSVNDWFTSRIPNFWFEE